MYLKKLQYSTQFNFYESSTNPHLCFNTNLIKKGKRNSENKELFFTATSYKNKVQEQISDNNYNFQPSSQEYQTSKNTNSQALHVRSKSFSNFYSSSQQNQIARLNSPDGQNNSRAEQISNNIKKKLQVNYDPYKATHNQMIKDEIEHKLQKGKSVLK